MDVGKVHARCGLYVHSMHGPNTPDQSNLITVLQTEDSELDLIRLIYASVPNDRLTRTELAELAIESARRNMQVSITGILWAHRKVLVQVLEGPATSVEALFVRIARDDRHRDVTMTERRGITVRSYGRWGMKLVPAAIGMDRQKVEAWIHQQLLQPYGVSQNQEETPDTSRLIPLTEVLRRLLRIEIDQGGCRSS